MKYQAMKLMGRLADGCERGQGSRYHALPVGTQDYSHGEALCGARAGRRSGGWGKRDGHDEVTCPRCVSRLNRHDQRAEDEHNYNTMIGESLHIR